MAEAATARTTPVVRTAHDAAYDYGGVPESAPMGANNNGESAAAMILCARTRVCLFVCVCVCGWGGEKGGACVRVHACGEGAVRPLGDYT